MADTNCDDVPCDVHNNSEAAIPTIEQCNIDECENKEECVKKKTQCDNEEDKSETEENTEVPDEVDGDKDANQIDVSVI